MATVTPFDAIPTVKCADCARAGFVGRVVPRLRVAVVNPGEDARETVYVCEGCKRVKHVERGAVEAS